MKCHLEPEVYPWEIHPSEGGSFREQTASEQLINFVSYWFALPDCDVVTASRIANEYGFGEALESLINRATVEYIRSENPGLFDSYEESAEEYHYGEFMIGEL